MLIRHVVCVGDTMRRASLVAAIAFVAASTAAANEQGDCLSNTDVELRIRSCSELIQREPNNATAYNSRGDYKHTLGKCPIRAKPELGSCDY